MPMEIEIQSSIKSYLEKTTEAASLAVFRILFGLLMCVSMIRFWYHGWIEKLYLVPSFHFHYSGFDWVTVPGDWTYLLFVIAGLSALFVALGLKYRIAIVLFFLSFTYIELMDKTTYLNHYYFVSVVSFMLIFLPAHVDYSIDANRNPALRSSIIPRWSVDCLKLMLGIVYFYAGLAKLNTDWLVNALPLSIWLPSKADIPLIGGLMHERWLHYLFSWSGAIYDLSIPFLLLWSRTRVPAFIAVVLFHVMTRILFPIGMFPWIMIASTIIFFSAEAHRKLLSYLPFFKACDEDYNPTIKAPSLFTRAGVYIIGLVMFVQLVFPFRHLLHGNNIYWTEQGYRFSWRVMLMEKTAYANFKIVDSKTDKTFYVQNNDFLNSFQEKQMSTQPDMILEYAQHLGNHFASQGHKNIEVYVESYASLNGRVSQPYISPEVNLLEVSYSELCANHIIPLKIPLENNQEGND
jgi:hypothetical protein